MNVADEDSWQRQASGKGALKYIFGSLTNKREVDHNGNIELNPSNEGERMKMKMPNIKAEIWDVRGSLEISLAAAFSTN